MKASELRIGNWINFNNKIGGQIHGVDINGNYQVTPRFFRASMVDEDFEINPYYAPIRLTEELLLKFGAIKYETPHDNQYRIGDRLFVIRDGIIYDYGTSVKLEYVHRFQNFMYEVTNEELTINQP